TKADDAVIVTMLPIFTESSIYQEQEEKINNITRIKPPPPLVVQPQVAREDIPASVTPNDTFDDRIFVDIPPTDVKTDVGSMKMQTEARPLVRFNPDYPPVAARDGVEGWVELSFSIDASGAVINVEVLNSDPKRIFDKAAKRALKRWKYQAKIEQGRAIVQHGLSVMLDFKISQ
ncbi:MAG: protein TonB, partial [Granulosicoccus sp.]